MTDVVPALQPILMHIIEGRTVLQEAATLLSMAIEGRADPAVAKASLAKAQKYLSSDFAALFETPDPHAPANPEAAAVAQLEAVARRLAGG